MKITRSIVALLLLTGPIFAGQASGKEPLVVASGSDAKVVEHGTFRPVMSKEPASPFAQRSNPKPLKVGIFPMYTKLPMKGKAMVAIELAIQPGWHINANPSNPDFNIPTTLELKTKQKVKLTKIKYPKHHPLKVQGSDEPYHVYDGKAIVYGLLEVDETSVTKSVEMEFLVRFQGCNSTQCLPPDMVTMKGKLEIAKPGEELTKHQKSAGKFPKLKTPKDAKKAAAAGETSAATK